MNIEEFKENFKKYRQGRLTEEAEERFENELEKLDAYQAFLETETNGRARLADYELKIERRILRRSQLSAYFRIGLISLFISLLLLPTLNLLALILNIFP